ncbi:hypothetical protein [Micromonospora sp. NPDC049107]|uniref:hypothetical protein n=2 Tax=unclassified Micromonospora TaxID=2617518 RepID=UPI0033F6B85A
MDRYPGQLELRKRASRLPPDWTMEVNPEPASLPAGLSGREVDAVARGPQGGIVFEVTSRRALRNQDKTRNIEHLRTIVRAIPGWDLELLVIPDPGPDLLDEDEIDRRIAAVGQLANLDIGAAFMAAFVALEWSLARLARQEGVDYLPNAQSIASTLVEIGVLDEDILPRVRRLQQFRNSLAHGVKGPTPQTEELTEILGLVNQIRGELANRPA